MSKYSSSNCVCKYLENINQLRWDNFSPNTRTKYLNCCFKHGNESYVDDIVIDENELFRAMRLAPGSKTVVKRSITNNIEDEESESKALLIEMKSKDQL